MDNIDREDDVNLDDRLSGLDKASADSLYFAVTLTADDDGRIIFGTPTQWTGWANEDMREELRRARLVYPQYVELWKQRNEPYAVVHTADDMALFFLGGGNALVEENLARHVFSDILAADRSIRDGAVGFISPSLLPKTAFHRAPTAKVRMQVMARDRRRCRICGRNPDDHLDLVLHVHHIRPWGKGGITDPKYLITLCHTCHAGLEPHDDPSLFSYLNANGAAETRLEQFRRGAANYRRVGFLSGLTARRAE